MKRVLGFIFTLLVVGGLIYIIKDINFYELYLILAEAKLNWIVLSFLATFMTFIIWNLRVVLIFRHYMPIEFLFSLKVLFAGAFFNTVTPGAGVGGEPFRAHFFAKRYNKPTTKVLGYVLGDTFFRIMVLLALTVFSILFVLVYVKISSNLRLIFEGILVGVFLIVFFTVLFLLKKSHFRIGTFFRKLHRFKFISKRFVSEDHFVSYINKRIGNLTGVFKEVAKNKEHWVFGVILSVVFWGLNILSAYFLFLAFYQDVNFLSVVIVFTLGNIIGSFTPIPGGIGVTEGSMTLLYSAMGVFFPLALLVAFLQRMFYYFFSLVVGGWCLVNLRKINSEKNGFF